MRRHFPNDGTFYDAKAIQAEVIATYNRQLHEIYIAVIRWINTINDLEDQYPEHQFFLEDLTRHMQSILDYFSVHENIERIDADTEEKEAYLTCPYRYKQDVFIPELCHLLVNYFDGSYIFIRQKLDPFKGQEIFNGNKIQYKGMCYGYVHEWARLTSIVGFYSLFPFVGFYITEKQDKQKELFPNHNGQYELTLNDLTNFKKMRQLKRAMDYYALSFNSPKEMRQTIDHLTARCEPGTIYELDIQFYSPYKKRYVGHAMGIRYLSTNEIEFYDPNFGIFVFPSLPLFTAWLKIFLHLYHYLSFGIIPGGLI